MFTMNFVSTFAHAHGAPWEDEKPTTNINMNFTYPADPTWDMLTKDFFTFLKANGYIFDYNEHLDLVKDDKQEDTLKNDFKYETAKRKGKAKA